MNRRRTPERESSSILSPPRKTRKLYRRLIETRLGDLMDYGQAALFRGLTHVCRACPDGVRDLLATGLKELTFRLLSRPRQICYGNLTIAAGRVWDEDRIRAFTERIYAYWSTAIIDFCTLRHVMDHRNWQEYICVHKRHHLEWVRNQNGAAIVAGLHMGNWEFMGQTLAWMGYPITSIARRRRHSSRLDQELMNWRTAWGQDIVYAEESPRTLLRLLRDDNVLGIVADQYSGRDGIFTDFFGAPTAHYPGVAVLANRSEVPVVPVYCYRSEHERTYHVVFDEPLEPVTDGTREENNKQLITQLFERFESYIRSHPEQWMWFHRKWRDKWLPEEHIQLLRSAPYLTNYSSS